MSKELVISSNRHETKVALLEDDQLVEVYFQRSNEYSLAGSIHKGRVTRVLPGMQSAFVDLGLERDTFLYVSDFLEEHEDFDQVTGEERPVREERPRGEHRGEQRRDHRGEQRGDYRRSQPPRAQAESQPSPVADASAAAGPVAEGMAGPISSEPGAGPAAGNATSPGQDRGGDRDRHGRRSRRRRGGGGFPKSKYAGEAAPPAAEAPTAAAKIAAEVEQPAEESTPIVLPGESLRKYKGPPAEAHRAGVAPQGRAPDTEDEAPAGAAAEDRTDNEYDEPIHYPPENALPDAPIHEQIVEEAVAEESATPVTKTAKVAGAHVAPEPAAPEAAASAATNEHESAETAEEDAEEVDDEPAVAPLLDEDEDRDIQAMILGDVEGIEIEALEGQAMENEGAEGAPVEGAGGEGPAESGTAEVRERGGRFPHRVSRRTRRRGRSPDSRGGPEGRGPEARGPETRGPEARGPEARSSEPRGPEGRSQEGRQERTVSRPNTQPLSIADLLKEGQEIIVQIAKEPLGQKGARITSHIALPGRYVVYMPTLEHMGVSRKIASDEERLRLKRILQAQRPGPSGGFITRTAAAGRTEEEIAGDMQFLYNLWQDIKTGSEKHPAPVLLHHDLDIVQRILRDQLADNFKAIWIDNEAAYEGVLRFVERFQPALVAKVKLYTREIPIFDAFNITSELEKALRPKVWLKSGGFIVINQTEALVAVDVNTGKYVGKTNRLEDTIVKTNTEAIKEIVRQIRLRDLGGIIVIDFIDMDERKNRQKVMQALEEAMRVDRAPYKILQFNDFGLVAITRKRVKQSLERTLCSLCPHCEGAGYIKSVQTVVSEILTEARKMAKSVEGKDVMLRVHPDVAKVLKSSQNKYLEELEEVLRRPVLVKGDAQLHHEKFDLA